MVSDGTLRRKKILLVSNLYPPFVIGGAEIYVGMLAQELSKDHEVFVLTTSTFSWKRLFSFEKEKDGDVSVLRFYPLNSSSVFSQRKLPAYLKPFWHLFDLWNVQSYFMVRACGHRLKPDIAHSHNISGFSGSVFSALHHEKVPIVHTLHDYHLLSPWAILYRDGHVITRYKWWERVYQSVYRRVTSNVAVVTAPSAFVLGLHQQRKFFSNAKKVTVPLGIPERFKEIRKQRNATPIVTYLGQVTDYKGVGVLLEAIQHIDDSTVRFVIAGTGPDRDRYMHLSYGDQRVEWPGFVSGDQKESLLAISWLTVVPSVWYDNSPVAIYESFAAGTPVVASRIGGIPELVKSDDNGIVVEPGNAQSLANAITDLLHNQSRIARLTEGARRSAQQYSFENHVQRITDLYASPTLIPRR